MPKFLSTVNLNQNQLIKHRVENYAGNPNGAVNGLEGQMLWDSVNDRLYLCTGGTTWIVSSGEITDTNTTYGISAETTTGGANLRLTGSDASTDNVKIAAGANITVTRTDADTITIASTDTVYTHPTLTARSIDTDGIEVLDTLTSDTNGHVTAATKRTLPTATTLLPGVMSATDKLKLDGVADNANNYTHPANHPASIITQDTNNRFVTDAEKATWNAKASTDVATTSVAGLMSAGDKTKLNGIADGAEVNVNADWLAASGDALILNKPTLGTAAALNTGTAQGNIPILGVNGKLADSVIPKIAITDTFTAAGQAAMLALAAEVGDIAVRTDLNKTYILQTAPATVLGNWIELATPTDVVQSVNGNTGVVTLTAASVGAEPAFSKNTGFNKNFGTTAGTVSEGNHTHTGLYTRKYAVSIGDGTTTTHVITHNLNTQDAMVTLREVASPFALVMADVEFTSVNTVTIKFAVAPTASEYRVIVIG